MNADDYVVNPANMVTARYFDSGVTTTDKFVYTQNSDGSPSAVRFLFNAGPQIFHELRREFASPARIRRDRPMSASCSVANVPFGTSRVRRQRVLSSCLRACNDVGALHLRWSFQTIQTSNNPDFTSILRVEDKIFSITHYESPTPGVAYLTELNQDKDTGKLSVGPWSSLSKEACRLPMASTL